MFNSKDKEFRKLQEKSIDGTKDKRIKVLSEINKTSEEIIKAYKDVEAIKDKKIKVLEDIRINANGMIEEYEKLSKAQAATISYLKERLGEDNET